MAASSGTSLGQPLQIAVTAPTAEGLLQQLSQQIHAVLQHHDDVLSADLRSDLSSLGAKLKARAVNLHSDPPPLLISNFHANFIDLQQQQAASQLSQIARQQQLALQQVEVQRLQAEQGSRQAQEARALNAVTDGPGTDGKPAKKAKKVQPVYMREDRGAQISILSVMHEQWGDERGIGVNGGKPLCLLTEAEISGDRSYFTRMRRPLFEEIERRLRAKGQSLNWESLSSLAPELQAERDALGKNGQYCSLKAFCAHLKDKARTS